MVCKTGSSRERDTVSFCLVSWHLAPGERASLALRNTAGGKNLHAGHGFLTPSSLHTSLSFGTQDRGPGHLSLDCEETTLEAKKQELQRPESCALSSQPLSHPRPLLQSRDPQAMPSHVSSKPWSFHPLEEAQGQPQPGENGRTSGGEGRCKKLGGVERRDEEQMKLIWA